MFNAVVIGLCVLTVVGGTELNDQPTAPRAVVSIKRNNAPVCLGAVVAISSDRPIPTTPSPSPTTTSSSTTSPITTSPITTSPITTSPTPTSSTTTSPSPTIKYNIITAAHCVYGKQNSGLTVQLPKENISVERVIVHPYYSPPSRDYDIAIITVKKSTGTSFTDLIASDPDFFPLSSTQPTGKVSAYSWNTEGANPVPGDVEERKSCKAKLSKNIAVSAKMLCANIGNVHDGTPLIVDVPKQGSQTEKQVVGIGSYYVKDNGALPKVFTNIANSEIYSFIKRYIF